LFFLKSKPKQDRFEKFAEAHYSAIYRTALRLTRNHEEASDLSQEAVLRAYQAFDSFDGKNFRAWVLRILTNLFINKYREKVKSAPISSLQEENAIEPVASSSEIPDRKIFDSLLGEEVEAALDKLPPDFKMAVILSDIEDMSYEDVALATGVPIGTVRSRLARARSALRKELEAYAQERGYIRKEMQELESMGEDR